MLIGPVASRMPQTGIVPACVRAETTVADTAATSAATSSAKAAKPFEPRAPTALRSRWTISVSFSFGCIRGRFAALDSCDLLSLTTLAIETAQLVAPDLSGDRERQLV